LLSSELRFVQLPLQAVSPDGHWHALPEQIIPPLQAFPQTPQLVASVAVFVQAPPQKVWFPGQATQVEFEQSGVAAGQTCPQAPQLAESEEIVVQVPLQFVLPSPGHGS
jgi:hypothetical protein